ncbi:MAG: hypothetical protein RBR40_15105 [Tenuifilaceae bacterium]|nr:hypothetical protein [Tenuifilaceae bacterium]
MRKAVQLLLCIGLLFNTHAQAQRINYLNYKTIAVPYTSCFTQKGDLKINLLRQTYFPDNGWTKGAPLGYRTEVAFVLLFDNYLLVADNRVNVFYGLTEHLNLSASFLASRRSEVFVVSSSGSNIPYKGRSNAFDIGAAYHKKLWSHFEFEVGTSLMLGKGSFNFEESISYEFQHEKSYLHYNTFNHNIVAGISFRHNKLQLTAQVNTGYLRHYGISYDPLLPYVYEHIGQHFYAHQTDFYIDPALIVNINFRRLGLQAHLGYPYTFGESKISKPTPSIGIGLSYKILQNRQKTEGLVVQP